MCRHIARACLPDRFAPGRPAGCFTTLGRPLQATAANRKARTRPATGRASNSKRELTLPVVSNFPLREGWPRLSEAGVGRQK